MTSITIRVPLITYLNINVKAIVIKDLQIDGNLDEDEVKHELKIIDQ